jgi:MEDS: MEthanogen/methylotroph, DcmR Sensory domain
MRQSWGDFLKCAGTHSHGVQVYEDAGDLADSVAAYLVAGFDRDQPGVLVATPEHMSLFAERLAARGWELGKAENAGLLVTGDAEETLARILGPHGLDRARFDRAVVDMLDSVKAGPGVQARLFGEMVDVLCRRGDAHIADELERLWNDVARAQQISLLCGYRLDIFDVQTQLERLPHICGEHSHILPAQNYPRFARAVDSALRAVLGPNHAATVYVLVSREVGHDQVPLAQSILMWVSENLPTQSSQILDSARAHYVRRAA